LPGEVVNAERAAGLRRLFRYKLTHYRARKSSVTSWCFQLATWVCTGATPRSAYRDHWRASDPAGHPFSQQFVGARRVAALTALTGGQAWWRR
jgi:hypothetical protein